MPEPLLIGRHDPALRRFGTTNSEAVEESDFP
jgi:hypothetical protein